MTKSPNLSIIILYYNSKEYLDKCLTSLAKSKLGNYRIETVVVNNGATDGIVARAERKFQHNHVIHPIFTYSPTNLGFSAGSNFGLKQTNPESDYVLFVNDDTTFFPNTIKNFLDFVIKHPQVDASTGNVILASTGKLAPETHRGFPTPWNTFWYFFGLGIPKLFPHLKVFHGYLNDYKDYTTTQKIDCCQGCFLLLKRKVGDTVGWWNEKYFLQGEDLDLCYQLRRHHFNLYFYPKARIVHYHGVSSGIQKTKSAASRETRIRSAIASTQAMRIFYQENLMVNYPKPLHWLILTGIKLLEVSRVVKAKWL